MVNNSVNKKSQNICFQCGSLLIFVNEERIHPEGTRFPQINIIYRCSNDVCQEKKDKEKVDRLKQQYKKAEMTKLKLEEMQEKRKQIKLAKEQQN